MSLHKSAGKIYFRTSLPADIARVLDLATDQPKQKIIFELGERGKVIVSKQRAK